tara:strand:- start:161 stop:625 length:465 start_codon:yes stop_codon:yes gene_type:complete
MSKNKKPSALDIVIRYHEKYLEYETAFNKNPFNEADMKKELDKVIAENINPDSEEFLERMVDLMVEKPQKKVEVNNAALKFIFFVDFYLMTQEDPLPENISKDYDSLPIRQRLKSMYAIQDGEFVKNEKIEVSPDMKNYFKAMIKQLKLQDNLN